MCSAECAERHAKVHAEECQILERLRKANDDELYNSSFADDYDEERWESWLRIPNIIYLSVGIIRSEL